MAFGKLQQTLPDWTVHRIISEAAGEGGGTRYRMGVAGWGGGEVYASEQTVQIFCALWAETQTQGIVTNKLTATKRH